MSGEYLCTHLGNSGLRRKVRIFAIPNALKQALLRPAHDWCMRILHIIPQDGTFDQHTPMRWIEKCSCLRSFDLSSATDRFPLLFQRAVIESLFNRVVAHVWTFSGLEVNVFRAPQGTLEKI